MKKNLTILFGGLALGALAIIRAARTNGIGAVQRVKRRIYKEVSLAQQAGIDFSRQYSELSSKDSKQLDRLGQEAGWKQSKRSIETGKPYAEAYFNSLRRAWKSVSGVQGIGAAYNVTDADGNVCLTWFEDARQHIEAETPAVETPAPKKSKAELKAEEQAEREEFAQNYLHNFILQHPDDELYWTQILNENDGSRADIILNEFVSGQMELKKKENWGRVEYKIKVQGKWYDDWGMNKKLWAMCFGLLKAWEDRGWNTADIDNVRRDLLDKAAHMQVITEDAELSYDYDRAYVVGDERYNYLDKINYIVVASMRYERGGNVFYPIRSYPDEASALKFAKMKKAKVVPIYDMDVKRITGIY